jgi:homoserine kinase type II
MDLALLWQAWPIAGPWHLAPLSGGTNNQIWCAQTADGKRYVLRLVPDFTQQARLRSEAALLSALSKEQLPFHVPLPIPTHSGEQVATLSHGEETLAFALLSPFLPGEPPNHDDPALAPPAGAALATLDNALAAVQQKAVLPGCMPTFSYEGLLRGDAVMLDPLTAVERLPISRTSSKPLQSLLAKVAEKSEELYGHLPQQLVHRDYDPSNLLMKGQRVIAVLDFEFAGIDLRVMDVCVALSWWPFNLMGTGKEWAVIDAFAVAYATDLHLSEEERRAIPDVLRLREAGGLIHHMQRYFAGRETDARIKAQVEQALWREAWLRTHGKTLREHAMTW